MSDDQYYRSHWQTIEDERFARYEQMFEWQPGQDGLLTPAGIEPGHDVVDFGCGPGFLALRCAEMVGEHGSVLGVDLNERFIATAQQRAEASALSDRVRFAQSEDGRIPLDDASADRLLCKNVLEYVPDPQAQLNECARVLRPGGKLHIIDSDWGFLLVEPWSQEETMRFFAAAAPAFKTPHIGRRLPAMMVNAGLDQIQVAIKAHPDRSGRMISVLRNMASYIETFENLPKAEVDDLLARAEDGVDRGSFMMVLPQFLVTGSQTA